MRAQTIEEQLTAYLADVHSIEVQALAQMKAAPKLTGDGRLSAVFREHLDETREHERLVREHLERRGADTSTLKDLAGRVGGWAMIAFARLNPDTPGKLTAHAFAYEHMELAAYELLRRVAERAHDEPVIELARLVGSQEHAMADRLAGCFDEAVDLSLAQKDDPIGEQLASYLTDGRPCHRGPGRAAAPGGSAHATRGRRAFRTRRCASARSTSASSSRPSRTRWSSSAASPMRSSTSRSPRTSCCAASPTGPTTPRRQRPPSASSPTSAAPRSASPPRGTPPSTRPSAT